MLLLVSLLAGVVEFGNLLNQYINLVDGARESARAASNASPFLNGTADTMDPSFYTGIDARLEGSTALGIRPAMAPVTLDPSNHDDVVISVFAISNGQVTRFPSGYPNGWSVYGSGNQPDLAYVTPFTDSDLNGLMTKYDNFQGTPAPNSGMVVVEVFYHYQTILQFIWQTIPVHAYAVMPLTAAEATPTPSP